MGKTDTCHGGDDPGAVNGNIKEKDFNLKVANYIYDRFKELGVPVTITRDTDRTLDRNERVSRILNAYGNDPNVIVLSNHINSGGGEGAEVVYALRNGPTLANSILEEIGLEGQKIRKAYQRRLPENPSKDYYFIQRLTGDTESLLIEYGFIDNPNDLKKLQNNLLDYGEAVVKAVANYIGVPYTAPDGSNDNTYVVQRGDSLYSIANKYGVTVDELKFANNLTSNLLTIGQRLTIPKLPADNTTPGDYIVYTVQSGDTLYKIANQYGTSVNDIIEFNQLPTTVLVIGQQLLIPNSKSSQNNTYTIKRGDSLWKIANEYGVTVNELIQANNLNTTTLKVGDVLIIPSKNQSNAPLPSQPEEDVIEYVVRPGDSLYSIALKYGITPNELQSYNNLASTLLVVGQILRIPTTENYVTYYVKPGDSLYNIARTNNTTVDEIKALNGLTSNTLSIGQLLILPK